MYTLDANIFARDTDRALRGADAVYVAVARRAGCTLVTLDREQRERAAPVVRTLTPAEALVERNGGTSAATR